MKVISFITFVLVTIALVAVNIYIRYLNPERTETQLFVAWKHILVPLFVIAIISMLIAVSRDKMEK